MMRRKIRKGRAVMRTFKKNASFKAMKFFKNMFIIIALGILAARYFYADQVHEYRDGYLLPSVIILGLIIIAQVWYEHYVNSKMLSQLHFNSWKEKYIFMSCINDLTLDEDYLIKNLNKKGITDRHDVQRYIKNYEYYMKLQDIL